LFYVLIATFGSFVAGWAVGRTFAFRRIEALTRRILLVDELERRRHHEAKLASLARHPSRQRVVPLQLLDPKHDGD